jgi:uncharacterized BrkB/YihY/UPF0761 family membrane protein
MTNEHETNLQVFLLFYGILVGLLVGVFGNLVADAAFEYLAKGDKSAGVTNTLFITLTTLIVIVVILIIATYHFYKEIKKHYPTLFLSK